VLLKNILIFILIQDVKYLITISNIKNGLLNHYHTTKLNNHGLDEKGGKNKTPIKNICSPQVVPKTLKNSPPWITIAYTITICQTKWCHLFMCGW
jgi:hypothetical protein